VSRERVVNDRYELVRAIGRGSSGVVYVARDLTNEKLVALKLVHVKNGPLAERDVGRFLTEIRAPRTIEHAGIVLVIDAGHDARGGALYVASELLHGESGRDLFERRDLEKRLDALENVLVPLSVAHGKGFVHYDLTPENVFLARSRTGEEIVKLLDFGLVRHLAQSSLSAPGVRHGTLAYMAPEQLSGGQVGTYTDVWAFGVMVYEAIAGRPPFVADKHDAFVDRIVRQPHVPLEKAAPNADPNLARLVDLCIDKDPGRRPPDARALMRLMKTLRSTAAAMMRSKGDPRSLLDTVMDSAGSAPNPPPPELEEALRASPRDPAVHRALLAFYRDGDITDGIWLAATALDHLGVATKEEIRLHHHYRRPPALGLDRGLDAGSWAALLHHDQDPRIDSVWTEIAEALVALHKRSDEEIGLTKAQKLDLGKPQEELSRAFAQAIGALRPGVLPRLYRGRAGYPPRHLPASPPASVFPRGFEEPLPTGALGFAVGRHVAYYRPAHRVCTVLHEPEALEGVFSAGLRVGFGWPSTDEAQARMTQLLSEQMSDVKKHALRLVCVRLGEQARRVDLGTWRRAVELSCCRAGLLLSADLGGAAWMLRWLQERRRIPNDDALDDLLAFWSSGAHVRLRHQLGLAVRSR
jgi:serine/threonine protein kinase